MDTLTPKQRGEVIEIIREELLSLLKECGGNKMVSVSDLMTGKGDLASQIVWTLENRKKKPQA